MAHFSPVNLATPLQFSDQLPDAVDICIVGGGVIGISTALCLAEQGHSVLVCEKGRVAGEQSSRNWGWVRQTGRDAAELPIAMEANQLWQSMAARTGENSLIFNETGVLYLADSETDLEKYERFIHLATEHGLESRLLTSDEVAARIPASQRRWLGALHTASDGRVEPWHAVPAMARAAKRAGAAIIEECAVRTLETDNGQIQSVVTEKGAVKTRRVLIAGGAWSSLLARHSGIRLPQLSVRSTVARAETPVPLSSGNAADSGLAFAARQDGGYTLALDGHRELHIGPDAFRYLGKFLPAALTTWRGNRYSIGAPKGFPDAWSTKRRWTAEERSPFEDCRVVDPTPDLKVITRIEKRLHERFPECKSAQITHAWAGMIDAMPDFVPVMDEVAGTPGLYIATGFSGHGFGIGPAAGRIMSDLMQGKDPGHDLSRFRLSRFADGSPLKLGPM